jgi:anti-anti-sigma factor
VGVTASLLLLLLRVSAPRVAVLGRVAGSRQFADVRNHAENQQTPGVVVLRPEGAMFFANAEHISAEVQRLAREQDAKSVVLNVEEMPFIDVTAAQALQRISERLQRDGRALVLAHPNGQVREALATWRDGEGLRGFESVERAVEAVGPG